MNAIKPDVESRTVISYILALVGYNRMSQDAKSADLNMIERYANLIKIKFGHREDINGLLNFGGFF